MIAKLCKLSLKVHLENGEEGCTHALIRLTRAITWSSEVQTLPLFCWLYRLETHTLAIVVTFDCATIPRSIENEKHEGNFSYLLLRKTSSSLCPVKSFGHLTLLI